MRRRPARTLPRFEARCRARRKCGPHGARAALACIPSHTAQGTNYHHSRPRFSVCTVQASALRQAQRRKASQFCLATRSAAMPRAGRRRATWHASPAMPRRSTIVLTSHSNIECAACNSTRPPRPDLLIVGNITVDIVDKATPTVSAVTAVPPTPAHAAAAVMLLHCCSRGVATSDKPSGCVAARPTCFRPTLDPLQGGGAVSYAAVAARALGAKACVVTVSGPERLQQLGVFEGHHLKVVPANVTLTFAHTYTWWGECAAGGESAGSKRRVFCEVSASGISWCSTADCITCHAHHSARTPARFTPQAAGHGQPQRDAAPGRRAAVVPARARLPAGAADPARHRRRVLCAADRCARGVRTPGACPASLGLAHAAFGTQHPFGVCRQSGIAPVQPGTPHHPVTTPGLLARLLYPPGSAAVGLMAQGFQRALGPQGEVLPLEGPSQQLLVSGRERRIQRRSHTALPATPRLRSATRKRCVCLRPHHTVRYLDATPSHTHTTWPAHKPCMHGVLHSALALPRTAWAPTCPCSCLTWRQTRGRRAPCILSRRAPRVRW